MNARGNLWYGPREIRISAPGRHRSRFYSLLFKPQGDCKYWLGDGVIMCSTQLPNIGCLGYSPHIRVSSSVKPRTHEFGLPTGDYLSASRRFCVIQLTLNKDQENSIGRQPSKHSVHVICLYLYDVSYKSIFTVTLLESCLVPNLCPDLLIRHVFPPRGL